MVGQTSRTHASHFPIHLYSSVPTYFVPKVIVQKVEQARIAMEALDGEERQSPMNIVGVEAGDEFQLPKMRGLYCRVFAVNHGSCPAVGYVILSRIPPQLKPEYRGLDSKQVRELAASGVSVKTEPRDVLEVAYTGDTKVEGLLLQKNIPAQNEREQKSALYLQQAFQCRLFLCEATFLDNSEKAKDLACKRAHLHINDIVRVLDENQFARGNSQLVLMHISARYHAKQALDLIADALPPNTANRCLVAISSLLGNQQRRDQWWTHLIQHNGCIRLSDYLAVRRRR